MGLKTQRESLRNERIALRAAIQASFKDADAKEREREDRMRTASTQVGTYFRLERLEPSLLGTLPTVHLLALDSAGCFENLAGLAHPRSLIPPYRRNKCGMNEMKRSQE